MFFCLFCFCLFVCFLAKAWQPVSAKVLFVVKNGKRFHSLKEKKKKLENEDC